MKRLMGLAFIAIAAAVLLYATQANAGPPDEIPPAIKSLVARCVALEAAVVELQGRLDAAESIIAANGLTDATNIGGDISAMQSDMSNMQIDISALQDDVVPGLGDYASVVDGSLNGLSGPHVIFEGVNVHVRNAKGATNGILDGLGNLVVGYNEPREDGLGIPDETGRDGSHNLIVGTEHRYSSFGGFVAGHKNTVSDIYSSVGGGTGNTARGICSSVSGGEQNSASGLSSSVSGGSENWAGSAYASVSGGRENIADGMWATVNGGGGNSASTLATTVSGGAGNSANAIGATVSGGYGNTAGFDYSTVSGGRDISTTEEYQHLP